MKTMTHVLAADQCSIHYPEREEDLVRFKRFIATNKVVAVDTETTGLDIYAPGHGLRLVQFGSAKDAWVLRADQFAHAIREAIEAIPFMVCHNATFDLLVLDRHAMAPLATTVGRTFDTSILAHLMDPRGQEEGGVGLGLKNLAAHYVDENAPDGDKALTAVFRSEYKAKKADGWALIDVDHPDYVRYAGLDVLLTKRLFDILAPEVKAGGFNGLSQFEHRLQGITMSQQKRGMLVDVPYTESLVAALAVEHKKWTLVAAEYGIENVNSQKQVGEALLAQGAELSEFTPNGLPKVDKGVLLPLADLGPDWQPLGLSEPNLVAHAVLQAKRADKWSVTYAQRFLNDRDVYNRIHPSIHSLQARTGRMSISNPPLQQLPSGDWRVRRSMVADPGNVIFSVDFSQVEMRVLAALSGDELMLEAIASGVDLHSFTAQRMYGDGFNKSQRKLAKIAGFGKVYGGGAATLSRQTGAPRDEIAHALRAYDSTYSGVKRWSKRLTERVTYGTPEVITPSGRRLPVDRNRAYAATNYVVQSTARDLLAQALVDVVDAGLGEHTILPIHDELLGQAPADQVEEVSAEVQRLMSSHFQGVDITADAEVGKRSWGSLYGADQ